jgi:hypothetical protein
MLRVAFSLSSLIRFDLAQAHDLAHDLAQPLEPLQTIDLSIYLTTRIKLAG